MDEMDRQKEFIKQAIDEILTREMKGLCMMEQVAITFKIIEIMESLHGMPLHIKIKIVNILSDYLHRSEGLIKGS